MRTTHNCWCSTFITILLATFRVAQMVTANDMTILTNLCNVVAHFGFLDVLLCRAPNGWRYAPHALCGVLRSTLMRAGGWDEVTPFCRNQLQTMQTA